MPPGAKEVILFLEKGVSLINLRHCFFGALYENPKSVFVREDAKMIYLKTILFLCVPYNLHTFHEDPKK